MGFASGRRMYLALIVVAVAAVLVYSFTLKPPEEITGVVWRRSGGFAGLDETLAIGSAVIMFMLEGKVHSEMGL